MLLGGNLKMANEQNLKPLNKRTKSEQRELAKKGGKASRQVKKNKKVYTRKSGVFNGNGRKRYKIKK